MSSKLPPEIPPMAATYADLAAKLAAAEAAHDILERAATAQDQAQTLAFDACTAAKRALTEALTMQALGQSDAGDVSALRAAQRDAVDGLDECDAVRDQINVRLSASARDVAAARKALAIQHSEIGKVMGHELRERARADMTAVAVSQSRWIRWSMRCNEIASAAGLPQPCPHAEWQDAMHVNGGGPGFGDILKSYGVAPPSSGFHWLEGTSPMGDDEVARVLKGK